MLIVTSNIPTFKARAGLAYPFSFVHPIVSATNWTWQGRQVPLPRQPEYVRPHSRPHRICMRESDNPSSHHRASVSRRCFTFHTLALVVTTTAAPVVYGASPVRTILDEERELNQQMRKKDEENRRTALRAAFEAVDKASRQLDDVTKFLDDEDWIGIRQFTRLFNNSVEREGMEPLTRQLASKQQRQDSLKLCKQLTQALQDMDQSAKREDRAAVLTNLQKSRELMTAFQHFKP